MGPCYPRLEGHQLDDTGEVQAVSWLVGHQLEYAGGVVAISRLVKQLILCHRNK